MSGRVIFTGGRNYRNKDTVADVLLQIPTDATIVTGGATGLDSIADTVARQMGFKTETYPADWEKHGRAAGPIRNGEMADLEGVEFVVAFEGGRGTANMVEQANDRGIPVLFVDESEHQAVVEL